MAMPPVSTRNVRAWPSGYRFLTPFPGGLPPPRGRGIVTSLRYPYDIPMTSLRYLYVIRTVIRRTSAVHPEFIRTISARHPHGSSIRTRWSFTAGTCARVAVLATGGVGRVYGPRPVHDIAYVCRERAELMLGFRFARIQPTPLWRRLRFEGSFVSTSSVDRSRGLLP